jgi:hypothetical protein
VVVKKKKKVVTIPAADSAVDSVSAVTELAEVEVEGIVPEAAGRPSGNSPTEYMM